MSNIPSGTIITRQDLSKDKNKIIKFENCNGTVILAKGECTDGELLLITQNVKIQNLDGFEVMPIGSGSKEVKINKIQPNKPINIWKGWKPLPYKNEESAWDTAELEAIYYLS